MTLFQAQELTHGSPQLFDRATIHLELGRKIGLSGYNGSGKSTLLKIIARAIESDAGECNWKRQLRMEWVPQFSEKAWLDLTLLDLVSSNLLDPNEYYKAVTLLEEFGFPYEHHERKLSEFSGGWVNRALLARAMASDPELLLLDEPTNHMDIESLEMFEEYLNSLTCAFVLVSHDRDILDSCTNETWFIRNKKLHQIPAPYSKAREILMAREKADMDLLKKREAEIDRLEKSAKRLAIWGKVYNNDKLAKKAKTIENRIEKLESSKPSKLDDQKVKLSLDTSAIKVRSLMFIENSDITIGSRELFHIESLYIRPGDRVAILGANGIGKSVFLRTLAQSMKESTPAFQGLRWNPNLVLGYYSQTLNEFETNQGVLSFVTDQVPPTMGGLVPSLIKAGFTQKTFDQPVRTLSGGQKARLRFLLFQLRKPNFFILDEPTNHLDIEGCEELEAEITSRELSGLIVSHDRRFIRAAANRFVLVKDGEMLEIANPFA